MQQNTVINKITNVNVTNVTNNITVVNKNVTVNNKNVTDVAMVAPMKVANGPSAGSEDPADQRRGA